MQSHIHHKHPRAMYLLALIEMCQRFAFWGIGNLLVLYLVQTYQFTDAKADHLYGIFSGIAFVLPLLGGFLADRTSHSGAVISGCLMTAAGCLLISMGQLHLLYIALALAALGASLFTPSIYTLLGRVYHDHHHLREGGFSIYYAAVNIGVFLATFILGSLGQAGHWGLAFAVACGVQLLGLMVFLYVRKIITYTPGHSLVMHETKDIKLTKIDYSRIIVIIVLSLVSVVFWIAYNQGWSSMSLFALHFTDLQIHKMTLPASWILSIESLFLVILAFPMAKLYRFLAKHHKDPTPITKTILSLVFMGCAFLVMAIGSLAIPAAATSASVSPLYPVTAYLLMAVAEMLLAPIGLSLVTHLSPRRYTALLVGVWYVCIGVAFYLGGVIAGFMSHFTRLTQFFNLFTMSCFAMAVLLACFAKLLNRMRHMGKS